MKTRNPGTVSLQEFLQEDELMKKFRHPKLLQLYGVCTRGEPSYIVTELMIHGSLLEYLREEGRSLKVPQLIDMLIDMHNLPVAWLTSKSKTIILYIH